MQRQFIEYIYNAPWTRANINCTTSTIKHSDCNMNANITLQTIKGIMRRFYFKNNQRALSFKIIFSQIPLKKYQ